MERLADRIGTKRRKNPRNLRAGADLCEGQPQKATPELRKAIEAATPGQVTSVLRTAEGYRIFKIFSKEPAGQRELTDPRVQQTIRETLLNRKDQLLKAAYYEAARNEAKVVNYLARSVVDNAGKAAK